MAFQILQRNLKTIIDGYCLLRTNKQIVFQKGRVINPTEQALVYVDDEERKVAIEFVKNKERVAYKVTDEGYLYSINCVKIFSFFKLKKLESHQLLKCEYVDGKYVIDLSALEITGGKNEHAK